MAQLFIKQVMESMGWTDGNMIPVANEENRGLLSSVSELLKEKAEKAGAADVSRSRVANLIAHCSNSDKNINQNVRLINAHRSQLTSESHLSKMAEHDDYKFKKLLKDIEKEHEEMQTHEDHTSDKVKRVRKNIERLSGKIDWAKQALAEWHLAMSKGNEANKLIERFCKEDQTNAKKLENRRRLVQDAVNKSKHLLIDLHEEQKSIEQVLQRTAQLYRQAHMERRQLIQTWKDAVSQMTQREINIEQSERDLEEANEYSRVKKSELQEQENFLNQQVANNKEVERAISDLNEDTSAERKKLADMVELNTLRVNEVQIFQRELSGLTQKLQQQRQKNQQTVTNKMRANQSSKEAEKQTEQLEERYKKFESETISAAERLAQLDELLESEEKAKYQLSQEIARLNNVFYRSQQQLGNLKSEEKILNIQNRGAESAVLNIRKSIKDDEKELSRKVEHSYNTGFKVQHLEMKINRLQGVQKNVDPEKEAHITNLGKLNERATKQLNLLQLQVKQVDDDMRKLTSTYNNDFQEMEKMAFAIKEKETLYDGGNKKLREISASNQEKLVELSILKMRVSQMENQIAKHDDKLFNLEKHRVELDKTVNERLINLKSQSELLNMKRKHLMEERATLKADIAERKIRIDAMKARYTLAVDLLGKNDNGTLVTVTQLRIETAQEKQMLLQEGNELNEKVLKAEKDIKAMENTLCLINYSNEAYRKSFGQCDDDNPQLIELEALKKSYCELLNKHKSGHNKVCLKQAEFEQAKQQRDDLDQELEELNRNRMDNNDIMIKIHKELTDQKLKLQRAEREVKAAQKAARQRINDTEYFCQFECELDLRDLEEKNTTALQLLADLVDVVPDLAPVVSTLLYEKGMKIPQVKHTKASSSYRSECSERTIRSVSDNSLQIFSASSKGSMSSYSSSVTTSSKRAVKACGTTGRSDSVQPSVVSLEFSGLDASVSRKCESRSSGSSKKHL